jgi:hypothetical protein
MSAAVPGRSDVVAPGGVLGRSCTFRCPILGHSGVADSLSACFHVPDSWPHSCF